MIRSLKALGLLVAAIAAFGAMSASAASAAEFTITSGSGSYPASIVGDQVGQHEFSILGGLLTCEEAHFTGELKEKGPATVEPTYTECTTEILGSEPKPTTVTTNGCTYKFTAPTSTTGTVHLECPAGKAGVEIHIYDSAAKHANNEPRCTFTVKPQTIESGITYAVDNGGTELTVDAEEAPVAVTRTSGTFLQCGAANQTSRYTGNTLVELFNGTTMIKGDIG